jgi:hypothetical protein
MIDAARFAQALHGLRLLLTLEPGGLSYFEKTYSGFLRSFFPALVLAPLQIIHVVAFYMAADPTPGLAVSVIVETLAYVLTWALFPFVMLYVTRSLGKDDLYFTYMVPYNWFQLLVGMVVLPLTLLVDFGGLGGEAASVFNFMILGLFLFYGTFLARTALDVTTLTAFGIVMMDILVSLVSSELIDQIPT